MPVKTKKPIQKKKGLRKKKVQTKFTKVLAVISIIGFMEILLKSFFNLTLANYSTFLFLMTMGVGLVIIANPKKLYKNAKKHLSEESFSMMTTLVLGVMSIIAAILSVPFIGLDHPILSATMGIVSVISIIFIIFQAWIIND